LDVLVGAAPFRIPALVDSGAVNSLFHVEVAREGELDLSTAQQRALEVGSERQARNAAFLTVPLEAGGLPWEAEVGFCDWMPLEWGLLGHSFFRLFTVTFRAYDGEFDVEPISA
jgi:hypothetical protein